jgi:hypothetical protein
MLLPQSSALMVSRLGPCRFSPPLQNRGQRFIDDASRVLVSADATDLQPFLATGKSGEVRLTPADQFSALAASCPLREDRSRPEQKNCDSEA